MTTGADHVVELPAGGHLELKNEDEVELWNATAEKYIGDYQLVKANDLILLGAILSQNLAMYRAQQDLASPAKAPAAQGIIIKASTEIRELEKALGIDKKTREAGGQHTVGNYIATLKIAAHEMGIRIADRVKAYEAFGKGLSWRIRMLRNCDAEDLREMGVSKDSIIDFCEQQLAEIDANDKKWAKTKGKVAVGKL